MLLHLFLQCTAFSLEKLSDDHSRIKKTWQFSGCVDTSAKDDMWVYGHSGHPEPCGLPPLLAFKPHCGLKIASRSSSQYTQYTTLPPEPPVQSAAFYPNF